MRGGGSGREGELELPGLDEEGEWGETRSVSTSVLGGLLWVEVSVGLTPKGEEFGEETCIYPDVTTSVCVLRDHLCLDDA